MNPRGVQRQVCSLCADDDHLVANRNSAAMLVIELRSRTYMNDHVTNHPVANDAAARPALHRSKQLKEIVFLVEVIRLSHLNSNCVDRSIRKTIRSEQHTSQLQSPDH